MPLSLKFCFSSSLHALHSVHLPLYLLLYILHQFLHLFTIRFSTKQIPKSYREDHVVWVPTEIQRCILVFSGAPKLPWWWFSVGLLSEWQGARGCSTRIALKGGLVPALGMLSAESLQFSVPSRTAWVVESCLSSDSTLPRSPNPLADRGGQTDNGLVICTRGDSSENHSNYWMPRGISRGHSYGWLSGPEANGLVQGSKVPQDESNHFLQGELFKNQIQTRTVVNRWGTSEGRKEIENFLFRLKVSSERRVPARPWLQEEWAFCTHLGRGAVWPKPPGSIAMAILYCGHLEISQ